MGLTKSNRHRCMRGCIIEKSLGRIFDLDSSKKLNRIFEVPRRTSNSNRIFWMIGATPWMTLDGQSSTWRVIYICGEGSSMIIFDHLSLCEHEPNPRVVAFWDDFSGWQPENPKCLRCSTQGKWKDEWLCLKTQYVSCSVLFCGGHTNVGIKAFLITNKSTPSKNIIELPNPREFSRWQKNNSKLCPQTKAL